MDQWINKRYSDAFGELRWNMAPTHFFNASIPVLRDNPEAFECDFEDHVVLPVQTAMRFLLATQDFKKRTRTRDCNLGAAEDEDIANEDCVWAPNYVIRFKNFGEKHEARLIGHVEFLAGQPGALSEAYRLRGTAKWGSLRCVLGDILQWMLMKNLRYSFVVSSDEIIFLKIDVKEQKVKDKTVLYEPWLLYSDPMKITDAFDAEKRTITVRMGLLHLFWLVAQNDKKWQLPDEMGHCLNYAVWSKEGEDLKVRRPCVPESSGLEKLRINLRR